MRSEIFSKSEVASIRMHKRTSLAMQPTYSDEVASICMHKQMSLAMQPTYSESVTLVAKYCRNTRNICAKNVYRRNMYRYRGVFEISVHLPLLNLLLDLKKVTDGETSAAATREFFLSPKQQLCTCANSSLGREVGRRPRAHARAGTSGVIIGAKLMYSHLT